MTRQKAIYLYCLECAGGSATEVTFCQCFDCRLWQFRCGYGVDNAEYDVRIKGAFERYPAIVAELHGQGIDIANFLARPSPAIRREGKRGPRDKDTCEKEG